jgi:hypothetical protein
VHHYGALYTGFPLAFSISNFATPARFNTKADPLFAARICENDLRVIRPDNETRSVAMRVNNPERSTLGING